MKCTALKRDGDPCTQDARGSDAVCWAHSPENAQKRKQIASQAGKSKSAPGEIQAIKRRIRELAEGVISGEVDRGKASVAFQGLGVLKGFIELERKVREQEELEGRLAALEGQQGTQGGRGSWRA